MKKIGLLLSFVLGLAILGGCASSNATAGSSKEITMVFYPNESAKGYESTRLELQQQLAKATGKKVNLQMTTDYNVAIEAISSGKAQLAYMGADGYAQAHKRSAKVLPLMTLSGPTGSLDGSMYHSYLMVPATKAAQYKQDGAYSIKNIKGKAISFVSTSSTSGYAIPTDGIKKEFKLQDGDALTQGGQFFKKVLYGNSHPGSAVNLFKGDVDVAAFDDIDTAQYLTVSEGSWDKVGSTFKVRSNAGAPFTGLAGKEAISIAVYPVQNGPLVANTATLSKTDQEKIVKAFTSADFAKNKKLFAQPNSKTFAIWQKATAQTRLVSVDHKWYKPTLEMLGF